MSESDLFVISAPSGTGKTTLIRRLMREIPDIEFSVSYTTRPPREKEREGIDYHFVSGEEFDRMAAAGELLEWAEVHGERYGTSSRQVDSVLEQGRDVLLDVDTQGAASVKRLRNEAVLVFVMPPDHETLRRRLVGRGSDSDETTSRRLANAALEIERYVNYDYVIINDSIDRAQRVLEGIILARRGRRERQDSACRAIVESFRRCGEWRQGER